MNKRINTRFRNTLLSIGVVLTISACSTTPHQSTALSIAQQGIFAAGGKSFKVQDSLTTNNYLTRKVKPCMVIMLRYFIKSLNMPVLIHWYSCMVRDNQRKHGETHLMVVKDSKHFSCASISQCM